MTVEEEQAAVSSVRAAVSDVLQVRCELFNRRWTLLSLLLV